jgi:hypothetical protein
MSEHDNDNLSRFFQKASNEPKIEFNENDWLKLEARLNAEATELTPIGKSYRYRFGFISAIAVLLLSSATYYLVFNNNDPKQNESAQQVSSFNSLSEDKSSITPDTVDNQPISAASISPTYSRPVIKKSSIVLKDEKGLNIETDEASENLKSNFSEKNINDRKTNAVSNTESNLAGTYENEALHPSNSNPYKRISSKNDSTTRLETWKKIEAQQTLGAVKEENQSLQRLAKAEGIAVPLSSQKDSSSLLLPTGDSLLTMANNSSVNADSVIENKKPTLHSRWSIVASFSPDFSTIGSQEYTAPGEAFGLVVHYHFNKRFSVSTGVVKSNKKYIGKGSDYKPSGNYWNNRTNGVVPEQVEGRCNVVEIPISIQYRVASLKNSSLFISGGMSSYFMRHESYKYTFETYNPGTDYSWASKKPSHFLFSIANFSVGYERNVSQRVAIGIEPYAKIPLANIGWANVKLFSTGASITFRYRLLKKKVLYSPIPIRSPD